MKLAGRWSLLLLLSPGMSAADSFEDFRIPEHKVFSWTGNLTAAASQVDQSSFSRRKFGTAQGRLGTSASWLHDSDPRLTIFSVETNAAGQRGTNDQDGPFGSGTSRRRSLSESWSMSLTERRYPWRMPLGIQYQVAARGAFSQNWSNDRSVQGFPPDLEEQRASAHIEAYEYIVLGGAAVGVGRVRDATAVYDVWVLEDRLRSRGVLRGPLSPETRERLAALIYNRSSYGSLLDRPGRRFWEDLTQILKGDGSFAGDWDPVSALRALEPYFGPTSSSFFDFLPRSPIARQRGWFAGATSEVDYAAHVTHVTSSFFRQRTVNDTLQPPLISDSSFGQHGDFAEILVGPSVEWHRPLGPRWQADARTAQMFRTRGSGGMSSFTTGSLAWIVTDRWLASAAASYQLELERLSSGTFSNEAWDVNVGGNLSWFLEDHLQLGLTANAQEVRFLHEFERDYHVSLTLGYRFAGRIENPGLTEPIRLR